MKRLFLLMVLWLASAPSFANDCGDVLDVNVKRLASDEVVNLCEQYRGKVILVVNTASKCGFTYQYEGLEELYSRYQEKGLVVLGFPSNDFANQEPGDEHRIQDFCRLTFGVKFPMFAKTHVAKGTTDPLYLALASVSGEYPEWNFHKYLIDRKGRVVSSFPSKSEPLGDAMVKKLESLL